MLFRSGAGPKKISEQVTKDSGTYFSTSEASEVIQDYFRQFNGLKTWLDRQKKFIQDNGFIYSYFGRKRRLPNVFSEDRGIASHEVRSGINFLVQSIASDINLLGAIDAHNIIKQDGKEDRMRIFALVHDSVLAEVHDDYVDHYKFILKASIQKDRGLSIPDCPVGCDFDVGEDYTLSVNGTPIIASFTRVGGRYVYDPSEEEELGGDERIHITIGDEGHLHSLQKGLRGVFTPAEFAEIFSVAQDKCAELRKIVAEKEGN